MSPLLQRIDRQLEASSDPLQRAKLLAERACYLARTGDFAGAKWVVQTLRSDTKLIGDLQIFIWIMTIEGLVMYFEHVAKDAYDRILRAHVLSTSGGIVELTAITAAWLAHIELSNSAYDKMQTHLQEALVCANSSNYQAQIRVAIVLGDAYLHSNLRTVAQGWYERARRIAVGVGDEAAIGAIMYNRAAFNLNVLRIRRCMMMSEPAGELNADIRFAQLEIESADQFQRGTRNASLSHLLQICRAQALQLHENHEAAIELYLSVLSANIATEDFAHRTPLHVDLVECLFRLNRVEDATQYLARVSESDIARLDTDDQFICLSKLRKLRDGGLPIQQIQDLDALFESIRQKYAADQMLLSKALSRFAELDPASELLKM